MIFIHLCKRLSIKEHNLFTCFFSFGSGLVSLMEEACFNADFFLKGEFGKYALVVEGEGALVS